MHAPANEALVGPRLQLSKLFLIRCCACFGVTLFGGSAITLSFSMALTTGASSASYWLVSGVLLVIWFLTLANMIRLTVAALRSAS